MDELISRQAAIDYCYALINAENIDDDDEWNYAQERVNQTEVILHHLEFMPSAQPKRGKWVFKTVFPNDTSEFPMGYLVCSECGSKHANKTPCNFCDNCGADMRGEA